MPDQNERALGAKLGVDDETPSIEPHLGAVELPKNYIVPAWRDCFDADFNPIPEKIRAKILDQGQQPSCVGHGTSVQKSAQEGVLVSPRDIFALAKTYDGDPTGWGTTLNAAQDAIVNNGIAEDQLIDRNPNVPQEKYRDVKDYETPAVIANREKHKGRQPFQVPRTMLRQTLMQYAIPVVTSTMWYLADNRIGADGIMGMPNGPEAGGHCIPCIGWLEKMGDADVYPNSFGPNWGFNGLFFVRQDGTQNRFRNGYITLDMPTDVAAIIAKYEGKDVKVAGDPAIYRIEGGKKRHYPNEIVWWASGRLFGIDIDEIEAGDLSVIPAGADVTIDECPFKTRELVRQVRAFYGKA